VTTQRKIQFGSPLDPIDSFPKGAEDGFNKSLHSAMPYDSHTSEGPYNTVNHTAAPEKYVPTISIEGVIFSKLLLRDACTCPKCVDPSSTQKNFQTTQIPRNIDVKSISKTLDGNIEVTWDNDIAEMGPAHLSEYPKELFDEAEFVKHVLDPQRVVLQSEVAWDAEKMQDKLEFVNFDAYMTSDESLYQVLWHLNTYGLVLLRGIPSRLKDKAVEEIAARIGRIRDTFYGRTWDVRSVPDAKNVAYTSRYLGLHMDLLYMANPPGYQFLHCMENTAKGGASIFSDASWAAANLSRNSQSKLRSLQIAYQYKNAGEHYFYSHPVLETKGSFHHINYSPPFQAPFTQREESPDDSWYQKVDAFRDFAKAVEDPRNVLEYRLQEGECVIFNNRRVLHGRKEFDALGGKRHYKGTYIDTDVVSSRFRVLKARGFTPALHSNFVFP
jgi:gamma-butyrobetaine dioxygenase